MSVASPTVLARAPKFPLLLSKIPQPHPVPKPHPRQLLVYGSMNAVRNLSREMDDLSEEEADLLEMSTSTRNRGFAYLVPIGRTFTQQEEKNEAEESEEESDGESSDDADDDERQTAIPTDAEEDEHDLDASMEDNDLDASMEDNDLDASIEDNDMDDEGNDEDDEEPSTDNILTEV
ncbi:hypothetical protein FISHEDRAFT_71138 [Fistulina hepatica ATCC 64428]|nr:hypothetical protein FISHEDRAFT_71138 [Fistulina hepatica ATCC 64428]